MNKRQAKKAFKKKYGCTPNQATTYIRYILRKPPEIDWGEVAEKVSEGIKTFAEALAEACKKADMLAAEKIAEVMKEIREGENHNS